MAVVFPLLAYLFAAPGLGVVADSRAVDCPSPTEVAEAIDRRMLTSPVGGGYWSLRYGWEGSAAERNLAFRLIAPGGAAALERRFPLLERECLTAAAAIAVIVERYFRDLGWTTG